MQSAKMSLVESMTNTFTGTLIGFGVSQAFYYGQYFIADHIIPGFEWNINIKSNIIVTIVLTGIAITRGFCIRRAFNRLREKNYGN